jgi:hypothetical protein
VLKESEHDVPNTRQDTHAVVYADLASYRSVMGEETRRGLLCLGQLPNAAAATRTCCMHLSYAETVLV